MIRWIPYAFVRIVLFFILGICLALYDPGIISEKSALISFFLLVIVYISVSALMRQEGLLHQVSRLKLYAGVVALAALFVGGYLNVLFKTEVRRNDHLVNINRPIEFYKAVVISSPKEKERSRKVEAAVQAIKTKGGWIAGRGKLLLYFSKDVTPYQYGDVLLIKGQPQLIPGPSNPEEFDYKEYLGFKNIYHQHFIRNDNATWIANEPPSLIEQYALLSRSWADRKLKKHVTGEREQGVVSALVLGVTEGLDDELLSAYKATGAMHVLAVSGLHVGIIYGLLLFILKPLGRLKRGPWVVAGISLIVLWAYAFVTGLSPSVLRAVTMFSFVAVAKPGAHRTNLYNTLAASAFCILLYDPFLIMSVGFQLSYIAVIGIVYLQSGIYNLWEPTNRVMDEIWKVSSVSIVAQLATFSIGLLYFHQFPNYFLLSNLFVIPGSFIVLILGLAVLAIGFVDPIASMIGFLLEWIVKLLNFIVFAIEEFPFSLIENVYITPLQCWLLIGILIVILFLIQSRKFIWVTAACFLVVLLSITQWYRFERDVNVEKFAIYNVRGHTAIDLIDRGRAFFIADSLLWNDKGKIGFHIAPYRIRAGVNDEVQSGLLLEQKLNGCSLISWKGKSFLRIYDKNFSLPSSTSVDYVIISNNAIKNWQEVRQRVHMEQVILDSSNSIYLSNKLVEQIKTTQTKVYSVSHQGAFELLI